MTEQGKRMRKVLQPIPLNNIQTALKTRYELKFLQQPKFARESTKSKRLLHPHPVVTLNVYAMTANGKYEDVTSHNLSLFFLKASVVETTPEHEKDKEEDVAPERVLVGNKVISGSLYNVPGHNDFKIINSKYHHRYRQQQQQQQQQQQGVENEVSGEKNGVIVFVFSDLGIVKRGNFKLHFELFKYECFQYVVDVKLPLILKINGMFSNEFKVYGSRQFYKKNNQAMFAKELELEKDRLSTNRTLSYLKKIKVLRDVVDDNKLTHFTMEMSPKPIIPLNRGLNGHQSITQPSLHFSNPPSNPGWQLPPISSFSAISNSNLANPLNINNPLNLPNQLNLPNSLNLPNPPQSPSFANMINILDPKQNSYRIPPSNNSSKNLNPHFDKIPSIAPNQKSGVFYTFDSVSNRNKSTKPDSKGFAVLHVNLNKKNLQVGEPIHVNKAYSKSVKSDIGNIKSLNSCINLKYSPSAAKNFSTDQTNFFIEKSSKNNQSNDNSNLNKSSQIDNLNKSNQIDNLNKSHQTDNLNQIDKLNKANQIDKLNKSSQIDNSIKSPKIPSDNQKHHKRRKIDPNNNPNNNPTSSKIANEEPQSAGNKMSIQNLLTT